MRSLMRTAPALPVMAGLLLFAPASKAVSDGVAVGNVVFGMEAPSNCFSLDEEDLGFRLAIEEANQQGGVHGRKLMIREYAKNGCGATEEGVANARKLVEQDHVFALLNFGGPASVTLAKYATEQKVPYLFPHTALVTREDLRYVFTSFPLYAGESQVMFRYLAETRGLKRIGIIHDSNIYGQYFLKRLRELSKPFGYAVAGAQAVDTPNPADLATAMQALRDSGAEAVVMALYPPQAKKAMEAKAKLDWRKVRMVSSGPLTDEQYLNVPGGFAEGTLGFCYYPDPNYSKEPGVALYRGLMERYNPGHTLNRYSLYGYVFGTLVIEGLNRAGKQLTRESFIDAMETIHNWSSGGILPAVSFSKTNHHAQRAGFICELKDARFQPLSDWIEP